MTWYLDIANVLVCLIVVLISLRLKVIPIWIGFILAIFTFIPYFLNDVLFPPSYMPDQFLYHRTLEEIRSFNYFYDENIKATYTAYFYSLFPLPFAETIISMGFYNRFLFLILFLWLYQKNFLRGMTLLFLLFYPSLVFYTSLTIRDPFIMSIMLVSVIFFIDKKYLLSFLVTIPLFFIKFQNFFLMLVFFIIFSIYKKNTFLYKLRYFIIVLISFSMIFFINDIILRLDYYRSRMFIENGGDMIDYIPLEGVGDFILLSITSFPYFLAKPLLWEVGNTFQLIQSLENIFVLFFLLIFSKRAYLKDSFITIKWIFIFVISLTIYGLVVFNFGTTSRYRYPFIVIYVVGLSYELYKLHGYKFEVIFKSKRLNNIKMLDNYCDVKEDKI